MPRELRCLEQVLAAAEGVLAARECDMLTAEEWERLARAVEAIDMPQGHVTQRFTHDADHGLTRVVRSEGREVGRRTVPPDEVRAVAEFLDEHRRDVPVLIEEIRRECGMDRPAIAAALEFLVDRGLAERASDIGYAPTPPPKVLADAAMKAIAGLPRADT